MNMLLDKDRQANELIVRHLLEREDQFFIYYVDKTAVRVAFYKGTWRVMRRNWYGEEDIPDSDQFFDLTDAPAVLEQNDKLLNGFIDAKIESSGKLMDYHCRITPSWIIAETLNMWAGRHEDIKEIRVTQYGRDGWFINFDDK